MDETKRAVFAQSKEAVEDLLMFWEEKDLFVQTTTRNLKPISQVAENITVITAKDIEDMNAHTVSEVLNRVTGVFVDFQGQDFGSSAIPYIQGSADRHVLVLLDGVTWNQLSGGNAETITIPVRTIDRIEIIKGPASSAWGSALGGVINIITKNTGNAPLPSGSLSASYGKGNSQDYSGEMSGKAGPIGYYLLAGHQRSGGLVEPRAFDNDALYAKFNLPVSRDVKLGFTTGYSEPHTKNGNFESSDVVPNNSFRTFFATASIDAAITKELSLQASLYTFKQKFSGDDHVLGSGLYGPAGDLFSSRVFDEKTTAGSAKLVWTHGMQTIVLGADMSHGSLDSFLNNGPFFQSIGAPATITSQPEIDKWAVFANDTITLGKFSITPGIRYDHNDISGSFTSPGLGATYKLAERTIIRASMARGFTVPPLAFSSGGGLFFDPNPSLKPESVWSYQAGIESGITDHLWTKMTVFRHDMKDSIIKDYFAGGPPGCQDFECNDLYVNKGDIRRQGIELEVETAPVFNTSFKAGFAYVHKEPSEGDAQVNYVYNLHLKYDDRKTFMAELFGHYIHWDSQYAVTGKYNALICDFNIRKTILKTDRLATEVFFSGHNIFNGSQYAFVDTKNPGRWLEAGLRLKF